MRALRVVGLTALLGVAPGLARAERSADPGSASGSRSWSPAAPAGRWVLLGAAVILVPAGEANEGALRTLGIPLAVAGTTLGAAGLIHLVGDEPGRSSSFRTTVGGALVATLALLPASLLVDEIPNDELAVTVVVVMLALPGLGSTVGYVRGVRPAALVEWDPEAGARLGLPALAPRLGERGAVGVGLPLLSGTF
ncbi:MAG: hypothetical protein R3F60_12495 [bacterium]